MCIVQVALVVVVQDVVGFLDSLEFDLGFFSFGFRDFVRMVRECSLSSVRITHPLFSPAYLFSRVSLSPYDRPSGLHLCLSPGRSLGSLSHTLAIITSLTPQSKEQEQEQERMHTV